MIDDAIEVHCDQCGKKNYLPIANTFQNTTIFCSECGKTIYWFSCPQCETSYYDSKADAPCPECAPKVKAATLGHPQKERSNANLFRIFSRPCPWCSHDIYFFFLKRNLIKCRACQKYSKPVGVLKGGSIAIVSLFFMVYLVDLFHFRELAVQYIGEGLGVSVLVLVLISSYFMILSKSISLEKWK